MNILDIIAECRKHEFLLTVITFLDIICIVASYFAIFFQLLFFPLSSYGCATFAPLIVLIPEFIILFLLLSIRVISKREMVKIKETD